MLDNRVTGNVYIRGRALGKVDAELDAYIDPLAPGGRMLAQHRPFRVVVDATLPDLSWIGPLIGDSVQFNGNGTINATIGGTPADPTASGSVRGQSLRLAWVDEGVRLENGTLDAVLEDGVLVINEWVFAGTPRVSPNDKRALEALATDRPFEVRAVGRLALSSLTGSIGIRATQLPVLQRPDRWMVVTGAGGITLTPKAAELYAKVTVDSAYIDFDAQRAGRTLPADVTVVRQGEQRKPAEAPPLTVTLDLQANLGDRFYITGAGLEARLAGEVAVTGKTSQLRAEGSVRTVDGVYAGYGQRLKIERGIVTFQGPVDNPGTQRTRHPLGVAGRGRRRDRRHGAAADRPSALGSVDVRHRETQLAGARTTARPQRWQRPRIAVGGGHRAVLWPGGPGERRTDAQSGDRSDHAATGPEQRITAAARDGRGQAAQRNHRIERRRRLRRRRQAHQR